MVSLVVLKLADSVQDPEVLTLSLRLTTSHHHASPRILAGTLLVLFSVFSVSETGRRCLWMYSCFGCTAVQIPRYSQTYPPCIVSASTVHSTAQLFSTPLSS